jgi:hypothetical protein
VVSKKLTKEDWEKGDQRILGVLDGYSNKETRTRRREGGREREKEKQIVRLDQG